MGFLGFTLNQEEVLLINPNTKTCPVFRTNLDYKITKYIYQNFPILLIEDDSEKIWNIDFRQGMFNMTSDSHLFERTFSEGRVALYEAKMIHIFDHRYSTYENASLKNINEGNLPQFDDKMHSDPNHLIMPRYWIKYSVLSEIKNALTNRKWYIGFRDVTGNNSERTAIFSVIPHVALGNNLPLLLLDTHKIEEVCCLFANLNSIIFDYICRQKLSGSHLNFFILKQLPIIPIERYGIKDEQLILKYVLELVYNAWDVQPFAQDMGYNGPPFKWDEDRRAVLKAELDAYYAKIYGLNRKQLRYILDPADLTPRELSDILDPYEEINDPLNPEGYDHRRQASTFPGETFRVLKTKEIRKYGEYRTRRLVLEAWERLEREN